MSAKDTDSFSQMFEPFPLNQLCRPHQWPCSTQENVNNQRAGEMESVSDLEHRHYFRYSVSDLDDACPSAHFQYILNLCTGLRVERPETLTPGLGGGRPLSVLRSCPLTGLSCGQARLRADHEAAQDTPAQFLSPLPWPSGVASSNKPERQPLSSAEPPVSSAVPGEPGVGGSGAQTHSPRPPWAPH